MTNTEDSMNHITAPLNCTSCGLCANVCPRDAIRMVWSADGFLVPSVDADRCVECGLCVKKCIALEAPVAQDSAPEAVESYGAWHRAAETQRLSSSGGVFSALAQYVFARGGCVFGVRWQDKETAVFGRAENEAELAAMRGSKYTPAMPGYVYREVREALKAGRYVLFSGTPCQVHALKAYLKAFRKEDNERLLTLDIACHGVPSRLILQKYIHELEIEKGCALTQVTFRDKSTGWANYSYSLVHHYQNGESVCRCSGEDLFMHMFISDAALNVSCYSCPYARSPRQGDLSVGDYWGVEAHHPEWPLNDGISTLIVNTPHGRKILEELGDALQVHAEPFERICEKNRHVYAKVPVAVPSARARVLAQLRRQDTRMRQILAWFEKKTGGGSCPCLLVRVFRKLKRVARAILKRSDAV